MGFPRPAGALPERETRNGPVWHRAVSPNNRALAGANLSAHFLRRRVQSPASAASPSVAVVGSGMWWTRL